MGREIKGDYVDFGGALSSILKLDDDGWVIFVRLMSSACIDSLTHGSMEHPSEKERVCF
jgi:hypothetical protein